MQAADGRFVHIPTGKAQQSLDAAEPCAMLLSGAALDRCVGAHLNGGRFSYVARAVRLVRARVCASSCVAGVNITCLRMSARTVCDESACVVNV